jgi:hypothetical protein
MRGEALGNKKYQELRRGRWCCCEEHFTGAAVYLFSSHSVTIMRKRNFQSLCRYVASFRCNCSQLQEKWIYKFLRENTVLISVRNPELNSQEKLECEARPTLSPNAVERAPKTILKESCKALPIRLLWRQSSRHKAFTNLTDRAFTLTCQFGYVHLARVSDHSEWETSPSPEKSPLSESRTQRSVLGSSIGSWTLDRLAQKLCAH